MYGVSCITVTYADNREENRGLSGVQVARRVRAHEQVGEGEQATGKRRAVRYQTCSRDDYVFLHPRSSLHSTAPEFVVYTQLISTAKRPYMAG